MSVKRFGSLMVCGLLASLFIACGGNDYKEFVADMDIEKRALERVKEIYPNAKIYDPISFVGKVKSLKHDGDFKPIPDYNYRRGSARDYKNKELTNSYPNGIYYVRFIVEKEKDKFYYVDIGCPFASDKPCIKDNDLVNPDNSTLLYNKKSMEKEVVFYTDEDIKKIKEEKKQREKLEKAFEKALGL